MGQYLIDNNVISNYFSDLFTVKTMSFISEVIDEIPNISVITQIEALSWINPDKNKEKTVQDFIKDSNVLMLSSEIVSQCIAIRRSRSIKTPDAIIAASAMVNDLTLITNDTGFNNIPGLKVINPDT
jgi:predicted nucleic acid-binding protein